MISAAEQQSAGNIQRKHIMGDKSPKSVQKQSKQKQTKANASNNKKQQASAAKAAASIKKK